MYPIPYYIVIQDLNEKGNKCVCNNQEYAQVTIFFYIGTVYVKYIMYLLVVMDE